MSEQMQEPVQEKSEKKEKVSRMGTTIIKIGALTIIAIGGEKYKVHARESDVNFSLARMPSGAWVASGRSSTGSYRRLTINATDAGQAATEAVERLHGLVDPARAATQQLIKKPNFSIAKAMVDGLKHLGRSEERRRRLRVNAGYFVDWCDGKKLSMWEQVTDEAITRYMKEVAQRLKAKKGKVSKYTLKHYWEPVNVVSKRMALLHAAHYRDEAKIAGFPRHLVTQVRKVADRAARRALSFADVMDFVVWLEAQDEYRRQLFVGVLLQALLGLRLKETFYLRWDQVRLDRGTIDVEDIGEAETSDAHTVKTNESVRRVPLPRVVWDELMKLQRKGDRILSHIPSWKAYGKAIEGAITDWRCAGFIEPKGLRRTITTHARKNRASETWNDFYLELFIGHAAKTITDRHYIGYDPDELAEEMRREVTDKIDAAIDRWRASKTAVSAESCSAANERPAQHIAQVVEIKAVG